MDNSLLKTNRRPRPITPRGAVKRCSGCKVEYLPGELLNGLCRHCRDERGLLAAVFTQPVAGIPVRFTIYHRDMRIQNDIHRFLVTNEPYTWLIMADPYGDMSADEFFSSGWAVRIFEGVSWRAHTAEAGEPNALFLQLRQRIAEDVQDYLKAAERRAMDDLLTAMRDYAAMVLDLELQSGLDAFFSALAEFAAHAATCTGCGYEFHEEQLCEDCERCAECCTCGGDDDSGEPICPDCGLLLEDCCCRWDGPYWSFDWRKARRVAAAFEADWFED